MAGGYDIDPYDPCPCGSGAKYKFCCASRAKAIRHGKFPMGTVGLFGPDDTACTKIAAGVFLREEDREPIIRQWRGTGVASDPAIAAQIKAFFAEHGVKNVVSSGEILGCPHEEGIDYPPGQDCPLCPFWKGRQEKTSPRELDPDGIWRAADQDDDEYEDDEDADDETDDADEDPSDDGDFESEERDWDAAFARMDAVAGWPDGDFDEGVDKLLAHLRANLALPCEVTGIEDFQWEERYVIGGWSQSEYKRLKKTQPSYTQRYQLVSIDRGEHSQWMMFHGDIAVRVRRIPDGKEFVLGLAELDATDKKSPNYQLLDDYSVWFVNRRM